MAHSRNQHYLVFMCRDYSSLSYHSVCFPVYRSIGQKYLNFGGRDLMVKGVVQEVLHHCNIFSSGVKFGCSVPDFCPKSTHPPGTVPLFIA